MDVYTFEPVTCSLVTQLPGESTSQQVTPEALVTVRSSSNIAVPSSVDTPSVTEKVVIRRGRAVYVVAKVCPATAADDEDLGSERGDSVPAPLRSTLHNCDVRQARRLVIEVHSLICQLDAVAPTAQPDHEGILDSGSAPDGNGDLEVKDRDGLAGSRDVALLCSPPAADADSTYHSESEMESVCVGSEPYRSLLSISSFGSVTFDPPSATTPYSGNMTESLSTLALYGLPVAPSHDPLSAYVFESTPSLASKVSHCLDDAGLCDSALTGQVISNSSQVPAFRTSDYSALSTALDETLVRAPGLGTSATGSASGSTALSPVHKNGFIRLCWGDTYELQPRYDSNVPAIVPLEQIRSLPEAPPVVPTITAAEWSPSLGLAILAAAEDGTADISMAGSSSSMGSLFSEASDASVDSDSESDEEPLRDTVRRLHANRRSTQDHLGHVSSAAGPDHYVFPHTVETRQLDMPPAATSTWNFRTAPCPLVNRKRKREHDEREEGEIFEYESDSDSEPDIPLAAVMALRRAKNRDVRPPPAKKLKVTPMESRRLSATGARPRRSWAHKRWDERLKQKHARAQSDGRRGIRIVSTEMQLLVGRVNPEGGSRWVWNGLRGAVA
ncbi:hypothetical protein BD309DRAFT_648153 [Dichomitus squalens]|uniref:Uncharacterized protein n=1 Tax=Dichomitus squalens TaxID=114155 RepID=A0A4Q9P983_9APHY|nr:hypothetical protein BD309DRAFT_648153 [Dichomitus squalens]TBU51179.1 hypothetical protein BD310DRAFT_382652 [Dichomitus squalens]